MSLDEAIKHAEEKANGKNCCCEEHAQLAEWLKELKFRRSEEYDKEYNKLLEDQKRLTNELKCLSLAVLSQSDFHLPMHDPIGGLYLYRQLMEEYNMYHV